MTFEEFLLSTKVVDKTEQRLISYLLGFSPVEWNLQKQKKLSTETVDKIKKSLQELRNGKPMQYILGETQFYGYSFSVNENVLIPRFETEELVENTITYIQKYFEEGIQLIDLGCGSGAIGLTLKKKLPKIEATLLDISEKALEVAKENAKRLDVKVTIKQGDMLEEEQAKYDVIISNPPYIKTQETIEDVVRQNEPAIALYAGEDGLDCYRKIIKRIKQCTKNKYLLALEIGYQQKEPIEKLLREHLDDIKIECKKDLQGRNRMIFVFHNCE